MNKDVFMTCLIMTAIGAGLVTAGLITIGSASDDIDELRFEKESGEKIKKRDIAKIAGKTAAGVLVFSMGGAFTVTGAQCMACSFINPDKFIGE